MPSVGTEPSRIAYGFASANRVAEDHLKFKFEIELTADEHAALSSALQVVLRLGLRDMYRFVVRNYQQLDRLVDFYVQLFGKAQRPRGILPRQAAESVMESTTNWLNSTRLFLDHEETWLKRHFGEDSQEYADFTKARHTAFDTSVAYRFLYKLRDFATHCGLPIGQVRLWAPSDEDRARGLSQRIHFELDRDDLLRQFPKWGAKVKQDLEQMPGTFELLPLIHDVMPHFDAIMETIVRIDVKEGVTAVEAFAPYMERIAAFEGSPVLIQITPYSQVSPLPIPVDTLAALSRVDLSGDVLEPFRVEPTNPLPARPAFSEYYQQRIGRGVDTIDTFLRENGATNDFHRKTRALLEADGHVEPLVTGLTVVGANAITLAASAMGVEPEAIIAFYGIEDG
jgi:hypothetical protein